jgi:hypothetical protein
LSVTLKTNSKAFLRSESEKRNCRLKVETQTQVEVDWWNVFFLSWASHQRQNLSHFCSSQTKQNDWVSIQKNDLRIKKRLSFNLKIIVLSFSGNHTQQLYLLFSPQPPKALKFLLL